MDHRQRSFTKLRKTNIAKKMNFLIKDFFSKCDQIRSFLRIWSHLLKKSSMENLIFCAVQTPVAFMRSFDLDYGPLKVVLTPIKVFLMNHLPTFCTRPFM